MSKQITSLVLLLLLSSIAYGQHYYSGETVYPIADAIRDQVNKDRQKYSNVKISEEAEIPVILNGHHVFMDTLRTVQFKDVSSISLNFENDKYFYLGTRVEYGVILIKTKEEEEEK